MQVRMIPPPFQHAGGYAHPRNTLSLSPGQTVVNPSFAKVVTSANGALVFHHHGARQVIT